MGINYKDLEDAEKPYELRIEKDNHFHLVANNNKLGVEMSVIPSVSDPKGSIEILISDTNSHEELENFSFGPSRLGTDVTDRGFWEEFGDRYAARFVNLDRLKSGDFKTLIFTDLVDKKQNI